MLTRRNILKLVSGFIATVPFLRTFAKSPDLEPFELDDAPLTRERLKEILLRNQQQFNETNILNESLSQYSLRIIDKLVDKLALIEIFSIQPFLCEVGLILSLRIQDQQLQLVSQSLKGSDKEHDFSLFYLPPGLSSIEDIEDRIDAIATDLAISIDRENISDCLKQVKTVRQFDFGAVENGVTIRQKAKSLFIAMLEMSNIVHNKTMRGPANRIIVSPEVSALFETMDDFIPSPKLALDYPLGVCHVGGIGRFELFKDPFFPPNKIFLARKGNSLVDCGYVYAPHVMINGLSKNNRIVTNSASGFAPDGENHYAVIDLQNYT